MSAVLDDLVAEYRKWSEEVVTRIRFANDLDNMDDASVDLASNAIAEARTLRDEAARRYIEESETLRAIARQKKCGHPPDASIVACAECRRVHGIVLPEMQRAIDDQRRPKEAR